MKLTFLVKSIFSFAIVFLSATSIVHAQEFPPKKTITMVVGFAAGGSADNAARIIAKKLSEDLGQNVIVVKNLKEYVAYAKKNPGKITFASTGSGSASHLQGELLNVRADIDTVHVPYKGGSPAMVDLLGGRVSSYYAALATAEPYIKSDKLIPIATTGLKRAPTLPNVPTIAESGYPGFDAVNWYAFVAPGKTSEVILDKWNKALVAVLTDKTTNKQLSEHGLTPNPGSREDLAKYIASQSTTWGKIIADRKITIE